MDNFGRVIGKAVGREPGGPKSEFLVVEDRSEEAYPKIVACEFYFGPSAGEKLRAQLEAIKPGDFVKVVGQMRSNRSVKGRLFTAFVAHQVFPLNHLLPASKPEQWPEKHQPAPPPPREPGEDDDKETQGGWF